MKRIIACVCLVIAVSLPVQSTYDRSQTAMGTSVDPGSLTEVTRYIQTMERMNTMPLAFTENQGQWDDRVKFRASSGGATIWFTMDGIYHQFTRQMSRTEATGAPPLAVGHPDISCHHLDHQLDGIEHQIIKASFDGANPNAEIEGDGLVDYKCNYFIGKDPSRWRNDVPCYESVRVENLYPGIDLRYYSSDGQMEYDLVVDRWADHSQVQIRYEGIENLTVAEDGSLIASMGYGEIRELPPLAYQEIDGSRRPVTVEYVIRGDNTFGFRVGSEYNPMLAVTIDPVLVYSTYLGGSDSDIGRGIALDRDGCVYVTGITHSTDFPTQNPYQIDQGGADVFVTKLNALGSAPVYSTYIGGDSTDFGLGIAIDASGCAYVTGMTESSDFPTENPYQTDQDWSDAFVTKLNASGNALLYSTYLGGSGSEWSLGIDTDGEGHAYVVGRTYSDDFPTENPYQTYQNWYDAFVTKIGITGNSLVYSTYLGGDGDDEGRGIAVDPSGCAYVTGSTGSTDFPTHNPYMTDRIGLDVFVTKLSAPGNTLIYSTYLGGNHDDDGYDITVDNTGCAYVTGRASSSDFPVQNPYQTHQGSADAFVTKLAAPGSALVFSTYLGGTNWDQGFGVSVDDAGCAYVTGSTVSSDFPTLNPYQMHQGDHDVFVTRLNTMGNALIFSSYLGGPAMEDGNGIAVGVDDCAYLTGWTWSPDFPTQDPYQTDQPVEDAFVTKLCDLLICGDANASGGVDIDDVVYLIAFIFSGGSPPVPYESGDANCTSAVDIDDVVWLIAYIFSGGNAPCDTDGDGTPDC